MRKAFAFRIPNFVLSAIAGGLLTLSFAPYGYWPCGLGSLSLLAWLYLRASGGRQLSGRRSLWLAFCFGLGLFGSGGSWVYVSITEFGNSSVLLGTALTGAFVSIMALLLALPFYFLGHFTGRGLSFALAFPALWFVSEWLRSWIFTGFPWLYAGYGQIETWLSGWAPVLSVYGMGLLLALSAAVIALAAAGRLALRANPAGQGASVLLVVAALLPWPIGALLAQVEWTQPEGDAITVGLVQANIPQEKKWLPEFRGETIRRYQDGSRALSEQGVDVIVWPEAALPVLYSHAPNLMQALQRNAEQTRTDLIAGILYDRREPGRRVVHNSATVFGRNPGIYHKRHLVPFGEYVPLEDWLRGTIEFFNLPTSFIQPGPEEQQPLNAGGTSWAPLICYEIVYPRMVADSALSAQVLLTISNDAWFGDSIGPLQHMQIAQMRALETGRYLVRSTNTGVTAIVDPRGRIVHRLPQFERANLTGEVRAMRGATPFMLTGITPVFALALPMLVAASLFRRRRPAAAKAPLAGEISD
ncbi:apolipoprotein N-acyltransferase [Microbulbifer thermotolerans]|uniref:apolipoprotein N-acyltransferase n=1 Tax=Microbulbifer thermotolerans TaxID=252514 RepID=UPI0008E4B77B|nr:apolipoprotein N-acyltransferase [Microbulbifer thermotolerans]MCX2780533.1 apolipoprotein N-acyltransferase [Microbulbifer thermotolerans]MCX2803537.1 apolipoprotein N-acyltransferase [Microbulbifer thermotolerans]MCX2829989.1 apolipoprotein N-acyltransferase [Microbulbifer thermotolerans]SFB68076.1 apolipoprotein N-acyltransferase [Microbulbifer thermotolerans]